MNRRIAMWAGAGLLIAAFWATYAFLIPMRSSEPVIWALARVSQPILLVGSYFDVGLRFYWVLLANAALYALVGASIETVRRRLNPAR